MTRASTDGVYAAASFLALRSVSQPPTAPPMMRPKMMNIATTGKMVSASPSMKKMGRIRIGMAMKPPTDILLKRFCSLARMRSLASSACASLVNSFTWSFLSGKGASRARSPAGSPDQPVCGTPQASSAASAYSARSNQLSTPSMQRSP